MSILPRRDQSLDTNWLHLLKTILRVGLWRQWQITLVVAPADGHLGRGIKSRAFKISNSNGGGANFGRREEGQDYNPGTIRPRLPIDGHSKFRRILFEGLMLSIYGTCSHKEINVLASSTINECGRSWLPSTGAFNSWKYLFCPCTLCETWTRLLVRGLMCLKLICGRHLQIPNCCFCLKEVYWGHSTTVQICKKIYAGTHSWQPPRKDT